MAKFVLYSMSEVSDHSQEPLYCLDLAGQEHRVLGVRNPGGPYWLCQIETSQWITAAKVWCNAEQKKEIA